MKEMFIVCWSSGEYSDWTTGIVCAYESEEDAKHHVVLATEFRNMVGREYIDQDSFDEVQSPYDPREAALSRGDWGSEYSRPNYHYERVLQLAAPPEPTGEFAEYINEVKE